MSFRVTKELLKTFLSESSSFCNFFTQPAGPEGKFTTIDFGARIGDHRGVTSEPHFRNDAFHVSLTCEARPPVVEAVGERTSWVSNPELPPVAPNATTSPIDRERLISALDYVLRLLGDGDSWRTRITDLAEVRGRNSDAELRISGGWIAANTETGYHAARVPGLFDTDGALSPAGCAEALRWAANKYEGRHEGMKVTLHAARLLRLALTGASRVYCRRYTVPAVGYSGLSPKKTTAEIGQIVAEHDDGAQVVMSSLIAPRQMIQLSRIGEAEASVCSPGGARMFCGPVIPDEALEGSASTKHRRVVFAIRPGLPLLVGHSTVLDPKSRVAVEGSVIGGLSERDRYGTYPRPAVMYLDGARYAVRDALAGVHGARVIFQRNRGGEIGARMMVSSPERLAMVSMMGRYHDNVDGAPYAD